MGAAGIIRRAGIGIIVISILPLLGYTIFGPSDGNPIGLGLLFVGGTALGLVVMALAGVVRFFRG